MRCINKIQRIIFTLSDGSKHVYSGKAFTNDPRTETRRVIDIKFTEPQELPEGYSWEVLDVK